MGKWKFKLLLIVMTIMLLASVLPPGKPVRAEDSGSGQEPPVTQDLRIGTYGGAPALLVNGEPEFPMFLFEQEISEQDAQVFQDANVKLYSFIEKTSFLDLGWIGPGQQDFSTIDRVMQTFVERVPKGLALPRIHLWAPQWWLAANETEQLGYSMQPPDPGALTKDASMASEQWRQEAGEALRRLVRHLLDGPYADRLLGLTLAGGTYGEWHNWNAEYLPDASEPMRQSFIAYLRDKYSNDLSLLRAGWGDPAVTFEGVSIPTVEERRASDVGLFRDPTISRRVIDYYEAYQQAPVDAINHFAGIVKEESEGRLLTSVLYGYSPDMSYMPKEVHHRAVAQAHRLTNVDLFTSPHSYYRRAPGDDGALRTYPDSLALHGKLFIDEADDRTHLAPPGTSFVQATNMSESLGLLRRAFGQAVTHATGMWYMDHSSGLWYNDSAFAAEFKNLKKWGDYSMKLPRQRNSEVAVISSNESEFYLGGSTDTSAAFYEGPSTTRPQGLGELSKAGAPFDRYLIEDLEQGLVPDHYKVYIFIDTFYLTDAQRAAVEKLKGGGRSLVWTWAPGYVSESGLSTAGMQSLTGISFTQGSSGDDPSGGGGSAAGEWTENFEGGSFPQSDYTDGERSGNGAIVADLDKVIGGSYSAYSTVDASVDWHEFLFTDKSKIKLEPGATYTVTFKAKTLAAPGASGSFYFLARTKSGGNAQDVGVNNWTDAPGDPYTKSFTFTLKGYEDYYLIWGLHNGGALAVDDIVIKKDATVPIELPVQYRLDASLFPGSTTVYGDMKLDPVFRPEAAGAQVWGYSSPDGAPSVVVRDFPNWRSVYLPAPPIAAPLLKRIYNEAGVHLYSESYDNLEASQSWVSMHAVADGIKTIKLPRAANVYDIIGNRSMGEGIRGFQYEMKRGDTAIFMLETPPSTPRPPDGGSSGGFLQPLSGDAGLKDLQVRVDGKSLPLTPSFASETTAYTVLTESAQAEIGGIAAHPAAKLTLQGKPLTGGTEVDLKEGDNEFELIVQAENGTKRTYTVTIRRQSDALEPSEPGGKPSRPEDPVMLTDILGHWAEASIREAAARHVVSGYSDGTFKPDRPVTRAEFVVMLAKAFRMNENRSALVFTDAERIGAWAKPAIEQAVQSGIVTGYSDGSFRPDAPMTRAEMAIMIARALGIPMSEKASASFSDNGDIPQWAKGAVEAIRKLGIVAGRGDGRFVPSGIMTRAEAIVVLMRMPESS
ncbi:S-layer homology domain-containing protein [Paenibacillus mendelii]|uniref:S-layer homology domain-containing protein n=1 Tax=Paenibacillus mendelii TaxID=206163 RepID=A0ABV6JJK1_9BACL|nr:S-layer homology domain-containing protein [Paenibacillus mendelii]MCQ6557611.1 S-layer homology domain-containing protein [Paenibacillus mendelii]